MKREVLKDGPDIPVKVAPVPSFELAKLIYSTLDKLYTNPDKGKKLSQFSPQDAFIFATSCPDSPLPLRKKMKLTPDEECEYAISLLRCSKASGTPKGVDEVFDVLNAGRRLNFDLQTLIDLVEQVLEKAGSRIDWDKRQELEDDAREHCDDDVTNVPNA